jgi:NitT/TauT family transport system ATP-binding protein
MTNRPGRIKKEVIVDLPRPRSYDTLSSPEFSELYGEVLESIRAETLALRDLGPQAA